MTRLKYRISLVAIVLIPLALLSQPQQRKTVIAVDASHPGAAISPTLFGIFFEDINFGADGGLYPERIKNRSFEFDQPLAGWHAILPVNSNGELDSSKGELSILTEAPLNNTDPHYLRVRAYEPGFGLWNSGFRGIGVETGADYRFSAYVRSSSVKAIRATITDGSNHELGSGTLSGFDGQWKRYETIIRTSATQQRTQLNLILDEKGDVDLDMVSLFPVDTWNHRPNGLRKDLVQLLADMHPGFLRFPGGCIVEGRRLASRYRWKTTVGDVAARQTIINRWSDEFDHRPTPDYFQSFGLGFYEYFQLAEDIGAQPLPILNCGMACQFNSSELAQISQTKEYIQDALDLIEFANGPATSDWGRLRAEMGHPAPFHLTMIGVGNEQWGAPYVERYKLFAAELKAKHPEVSLVVAAGPAPSGHQFEYLWSNWRALKADIVDEHYYMSPKWFLANSGRYDHYDRSGPKVFAGEYAAQTSGVAKPDNHNNWDAAIAEAAFMTGLERNADVVRMASYAPLLAHINAWQWTPDAIWFDNLQSYGTPNYYVQKVFANNVGTRIVPVLPHAQDGLYTSAAIDDHTHELIVIAVNVSPNARSTEIDLNGVSAGGTAKVTTLESADLQAENRFDRPTHVAPKYSTLDVKTSAMPVRLDPYSVTVYRVPIH
ncbi:MAG TPA: alpha-L-arabinofuranosidase C-terminal domain-containing protein [Candidatus Acidoferrum sp.]|nr:alpha-L-arabinofuranosidase C-terminal domain-containing protein [Candidatus Acidoferrum sp.]